MKRLVLFFLIITIAVLPFISCEGASAGGGSLTNEEVLTAVAVSEAAYATGLLLVIFSAEDAADAGIQMNMTTGVLTFSSYDISGLESGYSTISGTVAPGSSSSVNYNLTLTGGAVNSLSYSITEAQSTTLEEGGDITIAVTANGSVYNITLSGADTTA